MSPWALVAVLAVLAVAERSEHPVCKAATGRANPPSAGFINQSNYNLGRGNAGFGLDGGGAAGRQGGPSGANQADPGL